MKYLPFSNHLPASPTRLLWSVSPSDEFFECKVISFLLTKYVKTSQNSFSRKKSVTTVKVSFQDTIEGETVFSRHDLFPL